MTGTGGWPNDLGSVNVVGTNNVVFIPASTTVIESVSTRLGNQCIRSAENSCRSR